MNLTDLTRIVHEYMPKEAMSGVLVGAVIGLPIAGLIATIAGVIFCGVHTIHAALEKNALGRSLKVAIVTFVIMELIAIVAGAIFGLKALSS
jgi:hypothetical protein